MERTLIKLVGYKILILASCVIFTACDKNGPHQELKKTPETTTGDDSISKTGGPNYTQIKPILEKHCQGCHHQFHTDKASLEDRVNKGTLEKALWNDWSKAGAVVQSMKDALMASGITTEERKQLRDYAVAFKSKDKTVADGGSDKSCEPTEAPTPKPAPPVIEEELTDIEKANVVSTCISCHEVNGISKMPGVPHLSGLSAAYIKTQLEAYKKVKFNDEGKQEATEPMGYRMDMSPAHGFKMNHIVQNLTEAEITEITKYFTNSKLLPFNGTEEEVASHKFTTSCKSCHNGAVDSFAPRIQGQQKEYLANQLRAFKNGQRKDATMVGLAAMYTEEEIDELAEYISKLKVK